MRWLSIFRDPRIWLVVLLAAMVRVGWAAYLQHTLGAEIEAYEADLAELSSEERLEVELRTADTLAREILGVDLGVEVEELAAIQRDAFAELDPESLDRMEGDSELDAALAELAVRRPKPDVPASALQVLRYEPEPAWEPPAWLVAGAIGGLVFIAFAAGSWFLARSGSEGADRVEEDPRAPT